MKSRRGRFVVSALFFPLTTPIWACSFAGPESSLTQEEATLQTPIFSFQSEIRHIQPPSSPPKSAIPQVDPSFRFPEANDDSALWDIEILEVKEILHDLPEARLKAAVDSYALRRTPGTTALSEDLPPDIRLYADGARLYNEGKKDEALEIWQQLLNLPAEQRQNRSTWAAWMIARTIRERDGISAAWPWYTLCSRLSGEGYRDCLKLGLSSLGWQARHELDQGHYRVALELYYHQALAGDPTAWNSIRRATPPIEKLSNQQLHEFAVDPFMRGLITADLNEECSASRWLEAIEAANIESIAEASHFAELAYSAADFPAAERWLKRAPSTDPRAAWLRGKIDLMYGRTEEAEKQLKQAASIYPRDLGSADSIYRDSPLSYQSANVLDKDRISQIYGDLGATALGCNHYFLALTALYQGGFYDDAYYISERVLRTEELIAYTREHFPEPQSEIKTPSDLVAETARLLLARRLAREGRYAEALPFYPGSLKPLFEYYLMLRKKGDAFSILKNTRETALWEAARFHLLMGYEFFGTWSKQSDFSPGKTFLRDYYLPSRLGLQSHTSAAENSDYEIESPATIIPKPTSDELIRVQQNNRPYEQKAHYRYVAAELAWRAAQIMPDNSEQTAQVLGIAGLWLKIPDPKAADRFYKAMIWRNWSTPLAREANAKRWFPDIPWDYDPYAAAGVNGRKVMEN